MSTPAGIWQPAPGTSWNYNLLNPINNTTPNITSGIQVWDIDLFDNPSSAITSLHATGQKVICYFSAGSYENWRPDAGNFTPADLGKPLDGWEGEKWLNTSSANVRDIMSARLDLAVSKHCDGVDPDNIDGYDNTNGLGLTQADAVNYMEFLAGAAHGRNLSIGLKNAGGILPLVLDFTQWSVNEQCVQYDECATYAPYIKAGKPVFHVEYPKGDNTDNNNGVAAGTLTKICGDKTADGFSTIVKNMNLDGWIEDCPS